MYGRKENENVGCEGKKRTEGGGSDLVGGGRQRSEQDAGLDEAVGVKDPTSPGVKDIVAEKDGRKSAHGSRDEDGRQRNLPGQRGRWGSWG